MHLKNVKISAIYSLLNHCGLYLIVTTPGVNEHQ